MGSCLPYAPTPQHETTFADSEIATHPGSQQHIYVRESLAQVDRDVHPFVVVFFHRMMLAPSSECWRADESGRSRVSVVPISYHMLISRECCGPRWGRGS